MNIYLEKISSLKNIKDILSGKTLASAKASHALRQEAFTLSKKEAKQAIHNFVNFKVHPEHLAELGAKFARKNLSKTYRDRLAAEASAFRKSKSKVESLQNKTFLSRIGIIGGLTGASVTASHREK